MTILVINWQAIVDAIEINGIMPYRGVLGDEVVVGAAGFEGGDADLAMTGDKYTNPAMQGRWNYFLAGWEMRGVM